MSATKTKPSTTDNDLYRLAAIASFLLGLVLMAGASGHLLAVWPALGSDSGSSGPRGWLILLPGFALAGACMANVMCTLALWRRRPLALHVSLVVNASCATYLAFLLAKGIPGHPIGIFLTLVMSQIVLLSAIAAGLVWPVVDQTASKAQHSSQPNKAVK